MGETDKDKEQEATKSLKSAESGGKKSSMSVSVRSQGVNGNKTRKFRIFKKVWRILKILQQKCTII